MHLVAETVRRPSARQPRAAGRVTCEGSVGASITHDVTFSAGLVLDGQLDAPGRPAEREPDRQREPGGVGEGGHQAAGSCSLAKTTLLQRQGPEHHRLRRPRADRADLDLTVYLDATRRGAGAS